MPDWEFLNKHRCTEPSRRVPKDYCTDDSYGFNGLFRLPIDGKTVRCIASDGEEWLPVKGYESLYQVSNRGRVRAMPKYVYMPNGTRREHLLTFIQNEVMDKGYERVLLCDHGSKKHVLIHRLVAEHFIPNPHGYDQINHKDGVKGNNLVTNLEWCNQEYNRWHAIENGFAPGLKVAEIVAIKKRIQTSESCESIGTEFERSRQTIGDIKAGKHRSLTPPIVPSGLDWPYFWRHVSVSVEDETKPPTWKIMCAVKDLFWEDDAWVVQFHPPKSDYINWHPGCLHLWEYTGGGEFKQPTPHWRLVGPKTGNRMYGHFGK